MRKNRDLSLTRTKKAFTNVVFNFFNQIVTLVLAFISRTVFIHVFGVEYLGLNALFSDVLGFLSLADLGIGTAMVYSFYKPLAENDYQRMAALTTFYKKIYMIIAAIVAIVGVMIIPFLPLIVRMKQDVPNLSIYYIFSLANVVCSYLCIYKTSILTADQKNYIVTNIAMVVNVVKTIIQIIAICIFKNYIVYLAVGFVCVFINNIIASKVAVREYPFISDKVKLDKTEQKDIFKNIASVFLYKISSVLLNATDNILISVLVSTAAVGYYSNYLLIQNKVSLFYTLLFTSLTASIGNLIVKESAAKRYEIFQCEQTFSFMICGIVVPCYITLTNDLIRIWLGIEYMLSNATLYAIGSNMYLGCVLQPLWSYREATGLYQKTKWVMLICAFFNLILSIILGRIIGLTGIVLASGMSRLLTYVWYEPKVLFKEHFERGVHSYYLHIIENIALVIFLSALESVVGNRIYVQSFFWWFMKAMVNGMLGSAVVIVLYWKSNGFQKLLVRIKTFIRNFLFEKNT